MHKGIGMLAHYLFVEERVRQGRRVDGRAQVLRQDKFEPGREGTAAVVPRRVLPNTRERLGVGVFKSFMFEGRGTLGNQGTHWSLEILTLTPASRS
jgi:hypothetical protein